MTERTEDPMFCDSPLMTERTADPLLLQLWVESKGYAECMGGEFMAALLKRAADLIEAADALRAAQRAYLESRELPVGTGLREARGVLVGKAAAAYDALRANCNWLKRYKRGEHG